MKADEILTKLDEIEKSILKERGNQTDISSQQYDFIRTLNDPEILTMEQRSDEWFEARLGVLSASTASDAMSKSSIERVINKNLAEMATGRGTAIPTTDAMQWGIDTEDEARKAYEKKEGVKVDEVGFIYFNADQRIGCSPDGLVEDGGMVEFKCPNSDTHMGYVRKGQPRQYLYQVQHQMLVRGANWCDFVSYDPRVKCDELKLYIQRIYICKKTTVAIFKNLMTVISKVDKQLADHGLAWDKGQNKIVKVK